MFLHPTQPPAGPQGPPTQQPPQQAPQGNAVVFLHVAMQALTHYVQVEPDPADKQAAASIVGALQQLAAKDRSDLAGPHVGGMPPRPGAGNVDPLAAALAGHAGP